jgi:VanZ family protein
MICPMMSKYITYAYLLLLFVGTVVPLRNSDVLTDNYTLHIRWDYLLHAVAYLPLPVLLGFSLKKRSGGDFWIPLLGIVLLVTASFELLQMFIPYRNFNINDLLANGMGALLGMPLVLAYRKWISPVRV